MLLVLAALLLFPVTDGAEYRPCGDRDILVKIYRLFWRNANEHLNWRKDVSQKAKWALYIGKVYRDYLKVAVRKNFKPFNRIPLPFKVFDTLELLVPKFPLIKKLPRNTIFGCDCRYDNYGTHMDMLCLFADRK